MIKLNLGCGTKHIDGYINIDYKILPSVDYIVDINELDEVYKENSVNIIYASHIMEHFEKFNANNILKQIYKILIPGGIFRIAVPDWDSIVERYIDTNDLEELMGLIYGRHDMQGEGHYTVWSYDTLRKDLIDIGFKSLYKYDWRVTEHSDIDDFSRAYLPHDIEAIKAGKFDNHKLMSLNVEAIK